jgi:biotin-dependent carboxylase-like uncharacterized protein
MGEATFRILATGLGIGVQDRGRPGWKRFGVPPGGAMDDHAAAWANDLVDNDRTAPVIELLLHGAAIESLADAWIAITGADTEANFPRWRTIRLRKSEVIRFQQIRSGVWSYIAVEGGVEAPRWLGSASVYPRGGLGKPLSAGDVIGRAATGGFRPASGVAGRLADWRERRDYRAPPPLRVWPGPQWERFRAEERERFFQQEWTVSSSSDRTGYRLAGEPLNSNSNGPEIISEPVLVGSVQVPGNGMPIVTMRDGPTVGGYPKLGLVDAADVSWLAQCLPGTKVRFRPADEN